MKYPKKPLKTVIDYANIDHIDKGYIESRYRGPSNSNIDGSDIDYRYRQYRPSTTISTYRHPDIDIGTALPALLPPKPQHWGLILYQCEGEVQQY